MAIGTRSERRECLGFRVDNNKIIWRYSASWASPLLIFSFMRSFPPKIADRSCVPKRFVKFSTPQGRLRRTLCLGLKHPRVGRPFRARRLMSLHPGLKHLGYSVRPLRGHSKMFKRQPYHQPQLRTEHGRFLAQVTEPQALVNAS
jgi:hypothetical protein